MSIDKLFTHSDQLLWRDETGQPKSAINQLVYHGYQEIPRGPEGEQLHLEPVFIQAWDLNEAFFRLTKAIMTRGRIYQIAKGGSFEGQYRKQLDYATIHILYPGNRPLVPSVPEGVPAPTSQDYIDDYLRYLTTSEKRGNETYTYGQYLEKQILKVIKRYKRHRKTGYGSNQEFMTIGTPRSLTQKEPPCLRSIDTSIIDDRLNFFVTFRSWDAWAGFPSNMGGIQLLKEFMASEIGVADGDLVAASKGLHIYDYAWELANLVAAASR